MERLQRLSEIWSWLPAFRAVAETEHLPTAAAMLRVGPSSLSRSVRQIEQRLGVELFSRTGRDLHLTPAGEALLASVRQAMRRIDDGVEQVVGETLHGELKVACVGVLAEIAFTSTAVRMRGEHPGLRLSLEEGIPAQPVEDLLRDRFDVVLHSTPVAHPEIHCEPLATLRRRIYSGPGHPLYAAETDGGEPGDLWPHEFVAPPEGDGGQSSDGWPTETRRRVGLVVDQVEAGCEACRSGHFLAVLPELLVACRAPDLRPVEGPVLPDLQLFAVRRDGGGEGSRPDVVFLEVLCAVLADAGSDHDRPGPT